VASREHGAGETAGEDAMGASSRHGDPASWSLVQELGTMEEIQGATESGAEQGAGSTLGTWGARDGGAKLRAGRERSGWALSKEERQGAGAQKRERAGEEERLALKYPRRFAMRPEEDKVAYTKKKIRAQMEKNQGVGGGEIRLGDFSFFFQKFTDIFESGFLAMIKESPRNTANSYTLCLSNHETEKSEVYDSDYIVFR
jgi:hypothetical protein